jgi:hypothetical protein
MLYVGMTLAMVYVLQMSYSHYPFAKNLGDVVDLECATRYQCRPLEYTRSLEGPQVVLELGLRRVLAGSLRLGPAVHRRSLG